MHTTKIISSLLGVVLSTIIAGCSGGSNNSGGDSGTSPKNPDKKIVNPLESCQNWGGSRLCLVIEGTGTGANTTPTLTLKGLGKLHGEIRLFSDSACSNVTGNSFPAPQSRVDIVAPAQTVFSFKYYARYTHTDNTQGPCLGPVTWKVEETPSLSFVSAFYSSPRFKISGLNVLAGSVELFRDPECRVFASNSIPVDSDSHSVTATPLIQYGSFRFYAKHTDAADIGGDCIGPVTYDFISGLQSVDPIFSLDSAGTAKSVGTGGSHSCAILDDETLKCWGSNSFGQLGNGGIDDQHSPAQSPIDLGHRRTAKAIGVGSNHTCAILDDDSLVCWGSNVHGQLGTNSGDDDACGENACRKQPTLVDLGMGRSAKEISAGGDQTCAILDDDSLKCWGNHSWNIALMAPDGERTVKSISVGKGHACAILDDDSLVCWGDNGHGQLGDGTTNVPSAPVVIDPGSGKKAKMISAGGEHTCAVLDDDTLKCWGRNNHGQIGIGGTVTPQLEPVLIPLGTDTAKMVGAGSEHTCAILNDDTLKCWGRGIDGRLGDNTGTDRDIPTSVVMGDRTVVSIGLGDGHTCAILNGNELKCWGDNQDGQLGDGSPINRNTPVDLVLRAGNIDTRDDDSNPDFRLSKLDFEIGKVQLFSDESCATPISAEIYYAYSALGTIVSAEELGTFGNYDYWVKITEGIENQSRCIGPVSYEYVASVELEDLRLSLSDPSSSPALDTTPTLNVTGIEFQTGTIRLFDDSGCTNPISNFVAASSDSVSVATNTLDGGDYQIYVLHTDRDGNQGNCFGPVAYTMETLSLTRASPVSSVGTEIPVFSVTGLLLENGAVQLFRDSSCTVSVSDAEPVLSNTVSLAAGTLSIGSNNQFYVRHTDSGNNRGGCFGSESYQYSNEVLSLTLDSPNTSVGYSMPIISISGIEILNGTVQLFKDPHCGTFASNTFAVSSPNALLPSYDLSVGQHYFYGKHLDSIGNEGPCTGPLGYEYHKGAKAVVTSEYHVCAILDDGHLKCWGDNANSSLLGTGKERSDYSPASVELGNGATAKALVADETRTCAILSDDSLECWGNNNLGVIGINSPTRNIDTPRRVDLGDERTAKSVNFGEKYTCAILDDNSLKCWGDNRYGQLGYLTTDDNFRDAPEPVDLGGAERSAKTISTGPRHACAILDDDSLVCWGQNDNGQLGDGTIVDKNTPTTVLLGQDRTAKAISTGEKHTCAILDDNSLKCWGRNNNGQLGIGSSSNNDNCGGRLVCKKSPTVVDLGSDKTAKRINSSGNRTCAILDDDSLKCWGNNEKLSLGNDNLQDIFAPGDKIDLGDERTAKKVILGSHGSRNTCAILDDDSLKCWGSNTYGQLGNGETTERHEPVSIELGEGRTVKTVSVELGYICAILDNDSLVCWGRNHQGQLGDGNSNYRYPPTPLHFEANRYAQKVAIEHHSCAILNDDSLVCWGENDYGQLGDDTRIDRHIPTPVHLGLSAKAIALGRQHTCAILLDDESLKCWGDNEDGRLGDGTTVGRNIPTLVDLGGNATAQAISAGLSHTCAILDDYTLKCWGNNTSGQLGDGTNAPKNTPTLVDLGGGATAKAISAGLSHTCAILDDDTLKCWGNNASGQLGDGTNISKNTPTLVSLGGSATAKKISVGAAHTCAILNDDTLKCWGYNEFAQLGDISLTSRNVPTDVVLGQNRTVKAISAGHSHTCAILDDDSLWCWGKNDRGQLNVINEFRIQPIPTPVNQQTDRAAISVVVGFDYTCAIWNDDTLECWGNNEKGRLGFPTHHRGDDSGEMGDNLPVVNLD